MAKQFQAIRPQLPTIVHSATPRVLPDVPRAPGMAPPPGGRAPPIRRPTTPPRSRSG